MDKMGIPYESEYTEFKPYSLDIYVAEWHAAIEIDGPHHNSKKDAKRDEVLHEKYYVPVLRLPAAGNTVEEIRSAILRFAELSGPTAEQRLFQYRTQNA